RIQDVRRTFHSVDERAAFLGGLRSAAIGRREHAGRTRRAGGGGAKEVAAAHAVRQHAQHQRDLVRIHDVPPSPRRWTYRRARGSRASRSPSPTKLNASAAITITMPGMVATCAAR